MMKFSETHLYQIRVLSDGTIQARRHDRRPLSNEDLKAVKNLTANRQGITAADALRILGGCILTAEEVRQISKEDKDWAAIEEERSQWRLVGETWRSAAKSTPEKNACEHCGGKIVQRVWPEHTDGGCHGCGRVQARPILTPRYPASTKNELKK